MKKQIAVIYHSADFDGLLSMEVCKYFLKHADVDFFGWDYGKPIPQPDPGIHGKHYIKEYDLIYIVDLSVDALMENKELCEKIIWIDHHKSAIDKYKHVKFKDRYTIDGVAACRLCWQYFSHELEPVDFPVKQQYVDRKVVEPELLRIAGEYDIWDHRDPDAKALQFGLRVFEDHEFDMLVKEQFEGLPGINLLAEAITKGHAIKAYCDKNNFSYASDCSHTIQWEGLTFCALNIGQRGNSDLLLGGIKPEHDACFAWRYTGNGVLVSLYHIAGKEHHDLSLIAVKHGGGGHKGACGFRKTLVELAAILNP